MKKDKLVRDIQETRKRLERIRRDIKEPLEMDSAEQAVQLENREVLMELERVESNKLRMLEAQLVQTGSEDMR